MHQKLANAIRFLSIDMVEKAKSGHPGMPMGMADVATILFKDFIKFNPKDPNWLDRDRFILSAGHGSALLYSVLHLTGYQDMTMEELKNFRQLHSKTAGHPEFGLAGGIETTTGPLGQGLANAVGMALAERILNTRFGDKLVNHKTYTICGDGCLMEGISQEAISFAGHLNLKNLIVLFDDNEITIDGPTSLSTSENHIKRFQAVGWATKSIDGHNPEQITQALKWAQKSKKPVFIACKTTIGYGSPSKAGSHNAHGSPLGSDETIKTRTNLNWEHEAFKVPDDVLNEWRSFANRNEKSYKKWQRLFKKEGKALAEFLDTNINLRDVVIAEKQKLAANPITEASRASSGRAIKALFPHVKNLLGGSADLTGSNLTKTDMHSAIVPNNYSGNYVYYGIREHGMAAMMNGMSLHGLIPYGGTFLSFTDYARPAIRLSALMKRQVIYVMTHDSIGLGEDGPTHQPVEHLASLRAIPNLYVFRPADVVETFECWEIALGMKSAPAILSLSRQNLPQVRIQHHDENLSAKGAYILKEAENDLRTTIFATGSEVKIALDTAVILEKERIGCRVVSVPCMDLFFEQDMEYQMSFTCNNSLKVAIEAGISQGWGRFIGAHGLFIGMDTFGESAPASALYKHFGIVDTDIAAKIISLVKQ
jgi:transketolase